MRRVSAALLAAIAVILPLLAGASAGAASRGVRQTPDSISISHEPNAHPRHRHRRRHHRHHRRHHRRRSRHHRHAGSHVRPGRRAARASFTCANAGLAPDPTNLATVRAATLCLINRERVNRGERPLQGNGKLLRAAQGHSEDMVARDYFSHYSPSGEGPASRMRACGYIYSSKVGYEVGENIAWGTLQLATPSAIVEAWMHSPGHRANILDPHYRETAIGVFAALPRSFGKGQRGAIYTQDFGVIITG